MRLSFTGLLRLALCLAVITNAPLVKAQNAGPSPEALEKARIANNKCFSCHVEVALEHPPAPGMDLQRLRQFIMDPNVFKASDHGRLACTKCHTEGYTEAPHAADAKESTATCTDCHSKKAAKIEDEFSRSVHAKHMSETFTCTNCHNPHLMRIAEKLSDPTKIVAQDNRVCLGCHDSDETFAKFAPEKKTRPLIDDIHAWLPNTRLHWKAVRCVECHTPVSKDTLSHEILDKTKAERRCVSCHTIDSALNLRLYRHLVKDEQQKYGFLNSVILGKSYVIGATRNPLLDGAFALLAALTVGGVLAHGLIRIIVTRMRRKKSPEKRHE